MTRAAESSGHDLDFLADRRGQRELDLPHRSLPDVQIGLIVHVQFATVQPHECQRFRRHPGRLHSDLKPAALRRVVPVAVLQGGAGTASLGPSAAG